MVYEMSDIVMGSAVMCSTAHKSLSAPPNAEKDDETDDDNNVSFSGK